MNAFEKAHLRMLQNYPTSVQRFAAQLAANYDTNIALTATPLPVTAGRRVLLEVALVEAFSDPKIGNPARAARGLVSGLTAFWAGVPVTGGLVTAFLGGPVLLVTLAAGFSQPKISANQSAARLAAALKAATRLVQYVIPPAGPAFLIVP